MTSATGVRLDKNSANTNLKCEFNKKLGYKSSTTWITIVSAFQPEQYTGSRIFKHSCKTHDIVEPTSTKPPENDRYTVRFGSKRHPIFRYQTFSFIKRIDIENS